MCCRRKKAALISPANNHPMALNKLTAFYRSCLFQIIIVGLVGFCEPGIWTALNNLGAGGNASVSSRIDIPAQHDMLTYITGNIEQCCKRLNIRINVNRMRPLRRRLKLHNSEVDTSTRSCVLYTLCCWPLLQQPIWKRMVPASGCWLVWRGCLSVVG